MSNGHKDTSGLTIKAWGFSQSTQMMTSKAAKDSLLKIPILNPLTGEATVPSLKATAQVAAALELQDVPLSWRRVAAMYNRVGAKLTFAPDCLSDSKSRNESRGEPAWSQPPPGYELVHGDEAAKVRVYVRSKPSLAPLDEPSGPVPGVHMYFVVGSPEAVADWVRREYARYPPTSHGTSFYKAAEDHRPGGMVLFKGIRGSSC